MEKQLENFIASLYGLNATLKKMYETADIELLSDMNRIIANMHDLQAGSDIPALKAVDAQCKAIYSNFNMIVQVLRLDDRDKNPQETNKALNQFLGNIHAASVQIARQFGMID